MNARDQRENMRLRLVLRLLRPGQRLRALYLICERIALGICDLLLAGAMYVLFLELQDSRPAHLPHWLPQTALAAASWTVAIVLLRLLLDLSVSYSVTRFTQDLYAEFLDRLVRGYTGMNWNAFVQRNRSELIKHAMTTALDAAYSYQLVIEMVGGAIVIAVMVASLVFQSAALAGSMAVLALGLYLLHKRGLQDRLRGASAVRERSQRMLQRLLTEMFASIREVRSYRNYDFFHERMNEQTRDLGVSNTQLALLPQVSRIFAEQGVVLLFLGIIVAVLVRGGSVHRMLSLLLFYFVVSRRLLPLISQSVLLYGQLHGAQENLQVIDLELRECAAQERPTLAEVLPGPGNALELDEVSYAFANGRRVLDRIILHVSEGETVLLRGMSGSGKSSLLNLIAGVSQPLSGDIRIDRVHTAYVPQEIVLLDDSVRNNLLFGSEDIPDGELMEALQIANLQDFVKSLPEELDTCIGDNGVMFSGGQRQRLGIARAIVRKPRLLLLDEATSALDVENERQILERLAHGNRAVLLVTHRVYGEDIADRTLWLDAGKLVREIPEKELAER